MSEEIKEPEQVAEVWNSVLGAIQASEKRFRAAYQLGGSGRNRERAQCCYTILKGLEQVRKENRSKYLAKDDSDG